MMGHVKVPLPFQQGKERRALLWRRKGIGSAIIVCHFALAESLQERKKSLSSSWTLQWLQDMRAPPAGFPTLSN